MDTLVQNAIGVMGALRWVFTAVLLVLVLVNWAAGTGRIELNGTIGLRIPPLQRSEEAWKAGHSAGIWPAAIAFVLCLACAIISLFAIVALWGVLIAFIGGLIWSLSAAVRAANFA